MFALPYREHKPHLPAWYCSSLSTSIEDSTSSILNTQTPLSPGPMALGQSGHALRPRTASSPRTNPTCSTTPPHRTTPFPDLPLSQHHTCPSTTPSQHHSKSLHCPLSEQCPRPSTAPSPSTSPNPGLPLVPGLPPVPGPLLVPGLPWSQDCPEIQ